MAEIAQNWQKHLIFIAFPQIRRAVIEQGKGGKKKHEDRYVKGKHKLLALKKLLALNPLTTSKLYIMSNGGGARQSQLATSFDVVKKQGKISNQRLRKRLRGDIEDLTPEILVSQASALTMTDEGDNTNPNLLTPRTHNTDVFAIKLNRLREKSTQYNLHKYFLSPCIQEKLVPKALELSLEPTIGNYDQEFIDNWYSDLKDFSL